jgi:hypothetical protein
VGTLSRRLLREATPCRVFVPGRSGTLLNSRVVLHDGADAGRPRFCGCHRSPLRDIAIGAGATLMEIVRDNPDLVIHARVLTRGGTDRDIEEKNSFAALCHAADVRSTDADLPDGRLADHRGAVKQQPAKFHRDCEPDMVMGPQPADCHQDRRFLAESIPGEFCDQLISGYETPRWDSDLLNPVPYLPISAETAQQKARLPAEYGEAFTVEKALLETGSDYSVN